MRGYPAKTPERVAEAQRMRSEGATFRDIAARFGVSIQAAHQWVNDPDGSRMRDRRRKYEGTCVDCGGRTDGHGGWNAPERCIACIRWTPESAVLAVQEYFELHGEPPRHRMVHGLPHFETASRLFGSWNDLLLAAGVPLVCDRRAEVWDDVVRRVLAGESVASIADERGCTEANVYQRLRHRGVHLSERRAAA